MQVVGHYMQALLGLYSQTDGGEPRESIALGTHVAISEPWEEPAPTLAELQERCESQRFCLESALELGELHDIWPRYPHDQLWDGWPSFTVPILATAVARLAREKARRLGH
ncbi:hypothetical protein WME94_21230 [Sorangium sp. So ce429]